MNTPIQDPIAHACRLLRGAAEELKSGHTLAKTGHDWTGEPEAKAAYDEHRAVADALERWESAIGAGGVEPLRSRQCLHKISEPSASPAAPLSEQDAGLLDQGVEMLEALANDERNRGNCSSAMGAECSAHAVRRLAAALLAAERAALAAPAAVAGQSEMHDAMCAALTGGRCTCERNDPAVDKAWARFCGGIGDGPDAPYPGMISAFERYYAQSFTDKDWRREASVWAAAWKQAMLAAAPTTQAAPQLPERDASVPAEQQGLFRKFDVRRVDGSDQPGGKHHGCRYFVLDVDHDPCARAALTAYAAACEATHPALAADLRTKWGAMPTTQAAPVAQGDA